jgi:hypothetical protein
LKLWHWVCVMWTSEAPKRQQVPPVPPFLLYYSELSSEHRELTHENYCHMNMINWLTNSLALVYEQTIPTERPPLVGEVSVNFCR